MSDRVEKLKTSFLSLWHIPVYFITDLKLMFLLLSGLDGVVSGIMKIRPCNIQIFSSPEPKAHR